MPKVLPLPFGRAVNVPDVPVTLAFQLFCRLWPLPRLMVTVQSVLPLTARFTLNRSDHSSALVTLTVHPLLPPPPPPPLGGVVCVLPPPPLEPPSLTVMLE